MNCSEVKTLLSAYYDGELADDLRARVSEHLDQCADCSQELRGFERLSRIASTLSSPTPPEHLWPRIETELDQDLDVDRSPRTPMDASTRRSRSLPRLFVLAATILVAVGIGWLAWQGWFTTDHHDHFTAEFGHYLAEFRRDPAAAQQFLLAQYEHHRVAPDDAIERIGYRPVVADGVPPEYTIESTHVMKMPCCTCVQCVCKRSDSSVLVVYEHNDDDPRWFGNRPSITVSCDGKKCSLIEMEDSIAASWKHGDRHITLIGIRDVAEVANWWHGWASGSAPDRADLLVSECRSLITRYGSKQPCLGVENGPRAGRSLFWPVSLTGEESSALLHLTCDGPMGPRPQVRDKSSVWKIIAMCPLCESVTRRQGVSE